MSLRYQDQCRRGPKLLAGSIKSDRSEGEGQTKDIPWPCSLGDGRGAIYYIPRPVKNVKKLLWFPVITSSTACTQELKIYLTSLTFSQTYAVNWSSHLPSPSMANDRLTQ